MGEFAQPPFTSGLKVPFHCAKSWQLRGAPPIRGAKGIFKVQLRSSQPQTLNLFSEITAVDEKQVSARFLQLPEAVSELIQRLCFLQHRKQVAGARKSRKS